MASLPPSAAQRDALPHAIAGLERRGVTGETGLAENDELTQERDDDTPLVKDLRAKLRESNREKKALTGELAELRPLRTENAMRDLGLDPKSKQAKALLQLHGEGEQTADALRTTADEYGITLPDPEAGGEETPDPAAQQRTEATARIDGLRSSAQPVGTQKQSWDDYKALQAQDPAAAARALQAGQVEVPAHMASVLEANRAERAQQIGAGT